MLSTDGFFLCNNTTQPLRIQCTTRQNGKRKEIVQQTLTGANNITTGRKALQPDYSSIDADDQGLKDMKSIQHRVK